MEEYALIMRHEDGKAASPEQMQIWMKQTMDWIGGIAWHQKQNSLRQMISEREICLIAGASSGIGYAITESLQLDKNYQLIVVARRVDRLNDLKSENVDILIGDFNSVDFQDSIESPINKIISNYKQQLEQGSRVALHEFVIK